MERNGIVTPNSGSELTPLDNKLAVGMDDILVRAIWDPRVERV